MATNLNIDDSLLEKARQMGRHKTKKAAVNEALKEYVNRRKQMEIIDLFGSIVYEPNVDYKKQRSVK